MSEFKMKIINVQIQNPKWEKTEDGFLRCKARVLAERIMEYGRDEIEDMPENIPGDKFKMFVSRDEMARPESIRSLEGASIVAGQHTWLNPDNISLYSMGHVAGAPRLTDDGYLEVDLMVTNPEAIKAIEGKEIGEISGAYRCEAFFEPGQFDDDIYDAIQKDLDWNHIAVIPSGHGRAGADIRIFNKKDKEKVKMTEEKKLIRVKLKNTGRYINVEEEIAGELENEETAVSKSFEEVVNELTEKKTEAEALQATIDELQGQIAAFQKQLDDLLDDGRVEEAAQEMVEEQGEAEEILENTALVNESGEEDEKKKDEVMNSIKKLRGEKLHTAILNAIGISTEGKNADWKKGAFKSQHMICNRRKDKKVAGAKIFNSFPKQTSTGVVDERTALQKLGYK
jgi:hypothetical protein